MAMLKLCRCGKIIAAGKLRCEQCAATYDKERHKQYDKSRRNKQAAVFYNSEPWKVIRQHIKKRDHNICQLCFMNKKVNSMNVVHHIKELNDYRHLGLVESNLISLCNGCHRHVHAQYDKSNVDRQIMEQLLNEIVAAMYKNF
jgi:5-methylcytosine-specific restriction enzyme A